MPKGVYDRTPEAKAASAENMAKARAAQKSTWARTRGEANRRRREGPEARAAAAAIATSNWEKWRATNPDKAAEANRNSGLVSTAKAYRCECGRTIHGPSAFRHANATGHVITTIDNTD